MMTIKELKAMLAEYEDDQRVLLVNTERLGHDAVQEFEVEVGFCNQDGDVVEMYCSDEHPIRCCFLMIG